MPESQDAGAGPVDVEGNAPVDSPAAPPAASRGGASLGGTPLQPKAARGTLSPPRSVRRFAADLFTITVGVLIALSVEGLREWIQERRLVQEARESITREIEDNLAEVQFVIDAEPQRRQNLEEALRLANELLETEATGITQVDLGFTMAELSSASWDTAERTGAVGEMDYGSARTYARVYEVQELFTTHQDRMLERLAAAAAGLAQDPLGALPSDLEIFRQHVLNLLGDLAVEQELANMLAESYREVLTAPAGDGS
jgi:hypothetical protein